jgi:hypothetical protein
LSSMQKTLAGVTKYKIGSGRKQWSIVGWQPRERYRPAWLALRALSRIAGQPDRAAEGDGGYNASLI